MGRDLGISRFDDLIFSIKVFEKLWVLSGRCMVSEKLIDLSNQTQESDPSAP